MVFTHRWPAVLIFLYTFVQAQYESNRVIIDPNAPTHAHQFFNFVTRPDIIAPKWDVKVYDEDALSRGYWFVSPYESMLQNPDDNRSWVGPHIYDGNGDLIWSGTPLFDGFLLNDFRVSSVNGEDMLTGILAHKEVVVMVSNRYEICKEVHVGDERLGTNRHDFHTLENGTKALAMTWHLEDASADELRIYGVDRPCLLRHGGFRAYDTTTWEVLFDWSSQGHISPNESYKGCGDMWWDYVHVNSIDQFPDGDYLLSGRITDTVYKISGRDGSIVWRLGGKLSDFDITGHFSGQHSVRVLTHNTTHTVLIMLDNAIRPGEPHITNNQSRGLILALQTDARPMTAEVLRTYNHPQGMYAPGRGNIEILDNRNAFSGWWNNSMLSENAPNGELLMEAQLRSELRSYRCYKFDWHGYPQHPPDVYAEVLSSDMEGKMYSNLTTVVFVSWNGATEVATWSLYESSAGGGPQYWIASVPRRGFETMITHRGYVSHVVVKAFDGEGRLLGHSGVVATIPTAAVNGTNWTSDSVPEALPSSYWSPRTIYILGIATALILGSLSTACWYLGACTGRSGRRWTARHRDQQLYEAVASVDESDEVEKDQTYPEDGEVHAVELSGIPSRLEPS